MPKSYVYESCRNANIAESLVAVREMTKAGWSGQKIADWLNEHNYKTISDGDFYQVLISKIQRRMLGKVNWEHPVLVEAATKISEHQFESRCRTKSDIAIASAKADGLLAKDVKLSVPDPSDLSGIPRDGIVSLLRNNDTPKAKVHRVLQAAMIDAANAICSLIPNLDPLKVTDYCLAIERETVTPSFMAALCTLNKEGE